MTALWAAAVYLRKNCGKYQSLMAAVPATFMSAVCGTADEGLKLGRGIAYPIGILFALACAGIFLWSSFQIHTV